RLVALGYVVIRVTWDDVERRPVETVELIRRTLALRASSAAGSRGPVPSAVPVRRPWPAA
ncbi:MAG: hypothetical protein MUD13_03755, partial [Candidatus Nanopelagicales bacterium]|nr:hypothetical protein [Candidatus Nanopelagicales bacterium]